MADPSLHYRDDRVEITRAVVGPIDNNVFVVQCRRTHESVLVDAANEADVVLGMCRRLGVTKVLTTHGRRDHIQAVSAVRAAGYRVGIGAGDVAMLADHDFVIGDDETFEVGDVVLRSVHTPGHTPGSLCFVVEGSPVLLSGDTLFPGGPGATRFVHSDFPTIMRSIETRLFGPLPDDTVVMPGHGDDTTIGTERPHLQEWADRGW
ncbi:MAG: MBL fold metallo-hydrolase [Acidimicrobiales bacterium]